MYVIVFDKALTNEDRGFSYWNKVTGGNKVGRALCARDQGGWVRKSTGVGYLLLHDRDRRGSMGYWP